MYKNQDRSAIRVQSDLGEQVTVEFIAERRFNWQSWFLGFSVFGSFALLTLALVLAISWLSVPTTGRSLTIQIDPQAESVWVNNKVVGQGATVVVRDPPAGELEISVTQYNFAPVVQKVQVKPGADQTVAVRLELNTELDFRPGPEDVEDRPQGTEADRLEVMSSLEPCMGLSPPFHPPYSGTVLLYLDTEGRVSGVQLVGRDPIPVPVKDCFYRRAATVRYPKLRAGTFARLPVEFRYP
jgi:hypothetical protein